MADEPTSQDGQPTYTLNDMENDYRVGILSLRQMGVKYGMDEAAIRYHARKNGWEREKAVKREIVRSVNQKTVGGHTPGAPPPLPPKPELPKQPKEPPPKREPASMEGTIERYVELATEVIGSHRRDIHMVRVAVRQMTQELCDQMNDMPMIEERIMEYFAAKAQNDPIATAQYKMQMQQALYSVSLPSRSKTVSNLTNALEKLVGMERKSYGLESATVDKTYEEYLKEIHAESMAMKERREAMANITDV